MPQHVWVQENQRRYASEIGLLVREERTVESVVVQDISNNSMWEEGEALLK